MKPRTTQGSSVALLPPEPSSLAGYGVTRLRGSIPVNTSQVGQRHSETHRRHADSRAGQRHRATHRQTHRNGRSRVYHLPAGRSFSPSHSHYPSPSLTFSPSPSLYPSPPLLFLPLSLLPHRHTVIPRSRSRSPPPPLTPLTDTHPHLTRRCT